MQMEVGAVLEGRVTGITGFGAFVSLPDGKSGLVHISEVAGTYVTDIHEFLSVGQTVKVRVLGISPEGKISLSIKRAEAPAAGAPARPNHPPPTEPPRQFMQVSDSKMSGNRLYEQQKRSRGRRK